MEKSDWIGVGGIGATLFACLVGVFVVYHVYFKQKNLDDDILTKQRKPAFEFITRPGWPKIDNLPSAPRKIVGREDEIVRLAEMVQDAHIAAVVGERRNAATLRGPGGIGKTELATEYARRAKGGYEGVWVVPAESETMLHESLAELGRHLKCQPAQTPKQAALDALRAARDRDAPWLILFDNATDQKSVAPYLVAGEKLHCLVTSRYATWQGIADFAVDTLGAEEALALLRQVSGREDADFGPLLEKLDGYPLALVTAGGYFLERPGATVAQYLDDFDRQLKADVADGSYRPDEEGSAPPSIYGSVSLSIERLDRDAKGLLSLAASLSPDDVWVEMIEAGAHAKEGLGKHDWPGFVTRIVETPARLYDAVAALERASLLKREGEGGAERLTVHRLTQAVMRARLGNHGERWADAAARMVNAYTPQGFSEPAQWSRYARLVPQAEALLPHAPPSHAADRTLSQIGSYLLVRSDFTGAVLLHERAVEISAVVNGENTAPHAVRLCNLASSLEGNGDLDRAEALYLKTIALDESLLGDHLQTATHINNLAGLYWGRKVSSKAEPLLLRAKEIIVMVLGESHPRYAFILINISAFYSRWADFPRGNAERSKLVLDYASQSLKIIRQSFGEVHTNTSMVLNNLALFYHRNEDWQNAIPLMRRTTAILFQSHGKDDPRTQIALSSFVDILIARFGNGAEVEAERRRIPAEIASIRVAHVTWGIGKLKEIAARYGMNVTPFAALEGAVRQEAARLREEGEPEERYKWPLTEFQGAVFALQQAEEWGIDIENLPA